MAKFQITNQAEDDLLSIGQYTQSIWGKDRRNAYLTALDEHFQLLADNPNIGRDISDIREGYRQYRYEKHLIFYRIIADDLIEIVRILHERMDIEAKLDND